ncbi:MAG TPA: nucleotidyl transferase AbiEii/AbiGii toxin family protein [Gammaproteobacteria bacterium]|nr:nucleotidyl transferase AbiEii/AbiGii toxin family protein [Gammaproteobacteria bacterium]
MIEIIQQKLKPFHTREEKYNQLREFLQILILKIIDENGYFKNLAFVGGTALRILYGIKRFSEDLDFCLVDPKKYNFSSMMKDLERHLRLYNLDVTITYKDKKTVASASVKFNDILHTVGLSAHEDQKIFIKFEVDQNPPHGYQTQLSVINKDFLVGINHYDPASLFSGKLHAVLCRKYTKGRDYYDLIWYLSQKIEPNFNLLNNAIIQTEKKDWTLDKSNLKELLKKRIEETDFKKVRSDISPFLMDPKEIRFFEKDYFLNLLNPPTYSVSRG